MVDSALQMEHAIAQMTGLETTVNKVWELHSPAIYLIYLTTFIGSS